MVCAGVPGKPDKFRFRPVPWPVHGVQATVAENLRCPGLQIGAITEKILMVPGLFLRSRLAKTPLSATAGAGTVSVSNEIDRDDQTILLYKGDVCHLPGE